MSNTIDLNTPPKNHKYNVSVEPNETKAEIGVRLFKEVSVVILTIGFVCLVGYICYKTLFSSIATAEEKKWAMSTITFIVGGLIGYKVR